MATETVDQRSAHWRSVTVTTVATLAGVVAGLASAVVVGTSPAAATDNLGLAVLAALTFVSLLVMQLLGVDVGEFSTKDHLYVWFMAFALWFVTWGILLTTGVEF